MKNYIKNILIITVLSSSLISCASFSKKGFSKEFKRLEKDSINKLNGRYSYHPIRKYTSDGTNLAEDSIADSLLYNNAYEYIQNIPSYKERNLLTSLMNKKNDYQIDLLIENEKKLRIQLVSNSMIIKESVLTGKYKRGMFYLDNKYLKYHNIPFLLGGYKQRKIRIGITKDNNLIINMAYFDFGTFLFIIGSEESYNKTYQYKKIKNGT